MSRTQDDILTVAVVALAAMVVATVAHEVIGHGSVCLAIGGRVTKLTSVYFQCSARSTWIAAGGPLGNLGAAALAWVGLRLSPVPAASLRWFLAILLAISLYWFVGYLLYSVVTNNGDLYFVAVDVIGHPTSSERVVAGLAGLGLYRVSAQLVNAEVSCFSTVDDPDRAARLARWSWLAASTGAVLAALLYAPDRLNAARQSVLEIGAATWPLLLVSGRTIATSEPPVRRSRVLIGFGALIFAAFAATLGRGLGQ